MKLVKFQRPDGTSGMGALDAATVRVFDAARFVPDATLGDLLAAPDFVSVAGQLLAESQESLPLADVRLLAPVDRQEIWAAGVTYLRSREARERESEGAAVFYDLVYKADRPELFFKATAERCVGPGQPVRIRRDAKWSVPEPELALVVSPDLRIVGYTVGNDMSSRDIEGENPLYLPQAKLYKQSCALGPCVVLADAMPPRAEVEIGLKIERGGREVFAGATSVGRMARSLESLVEWLGRDNEFPHGVVLLTGTGVVPPDQFTLEAGDVVSITISGVGTLTNTVVCG